MNSTRSDLCKPIGRGESTGQYWFYRLSSCRDINSRHVWNSSKSIDTGMHSWKSSRQGTDSINDRSLQVTVLDISVSDRLWYAYLIQPEFNSSNLAKLYWFIITVHTLATHTFCSFDITRSVVKRNCKYWKWFSHHWTYMYCPRKQCVMPAVHTIISRKWNSSLFTFQLPVLTKFGLTKNSF